MNSPLKIGLGCLFLAVCVFGQDAWHRAHDKGNRYEGLVDNPTGNPPLEILSFTGYLQPFTGVQEWRVWFFSQTERRVVVFARDITDETHYFMESKPVIARTQQWSEFDKWDTGEVLVKESVKPGNVGVTAVATDGSYLPAIVYPAGARIPPHISKYRLQLRLSRTVDQIEYVIEGVDSEGKPVTARGKSAGAHEGGVPFPLEINVDKFSFGRMSIAMRLSNRSEAMSSKELKFYHSPGTAN